MIEAPALDIDKQLGQPTGHAKVERRVAANLLDTLQRGGFEIVGIFDEDDGQTDRTHNDIKATMELIFNLDEAYLIVKKGSHRHTILIVLGNGEACDMIADWNFYTDDPDGFNALMEKFDPEAYA